MLRLANYSLPRTLQATRPSLDTLNTIAYNIIMRRLLAVKEPRSPLHPRLVSSSSHSSPSSSNKKSASQRPNPGNPELPSFDLSALGLSKNMKMLVLGLVGIFGTIETWFWCKAIWQWWEGRQEGKPDDVAAKG